MTERQNSTRVRVLSSIAINVAIESVRVPEQEREKEREPPTEMIDDWKKGVRGELVWRRVACVMLGMSGGRRRKRPYDS